MFNQETLDRLSAAAAEVGKDDMSIEELGQQNFEPAAPDAIEYLKSINGHAGDLKTTCSFASIVLRLTKEQLIDLVNDLREDQPDFERSLHALKAQSDIFRPLSDLLFAALSRLMVAWAASVTAPPMEARS